MICTSYRSMPWYDMSCHGASYRGSYKNLPKEFYNMQNSITLCMTVYHTFLCIVIGCKRRFSGKAQRNF